MFFNLLKTIVCRKGSKRKKFRTMFY